VYTDAEVQRLRYLSELVRLGHSIGKVAGLPDQKLISLLNQSKTVIASRHDVGLGPENQENLELLFKAMDAFDLAAVRSALARIRHLVSPRVFAFELIPQAMFLIGKRIDEGKFSISQEHALSEIMHSQMRKIYDDLESLDGSSSPVQSLIFSTREGDPHDFGLMMAAMACRYRGFRTHYIGKNLPTDSLLEAVKKIKPIAVVVGVAALPPEEEKIAPMDFLADLDRRLGAGIEIWAGGSASPNIRKPSDRRDFWIFESMGDFEAKLSLKMGKSSPSKKK
jgi:hypothetical protein